VRRLLILLMLWPVPVMAADQCPPGTVVTGT
jgi:hypothetical protein